MSAIDINQDEENINTKPKQLDAEQREMKTHLLSRRRWEILVELFEIDAELEELELQRTIPKT